MFRTLRAFLWMRWRIARNAFKGRNRDTFEQISRALGALAPIFMILLLIPTVLGLAAAAIFAGYRIGLADTVMIHESWVFLGARAGLAIATFVLLIAPMVRSSRGTGSEMTRLLLLPIRRRMLHFSEVIGALADPWLGILFPALLLFPLGLAFGGSPVGGAVAFVGAVLFVSILMLAISLASFTIALIFRKRKRAEWFTIVLITGLSMSGMLAGIWGNTFEKKIKSEHDAARFEHPQEKEHGGLPFERVDEALPAITQFLPSELYTQSVRFGVDRNVAQTGYRLILLALWAAGLYAASLWAYSRMLETPETGGGSGGGRFRATLREIPWVGTGASAVGLATLRLALRSVRGKTGVYLNFAFVAMIFVIFRPHRIGLELPAGTGFGMAIGVIGTVFTLLSLQPILVNIFAIDGPGLTLQALNPLTTREILRGKWVGGALLTAISTGLCFATGFILDPSGSALMWIAALLLAASTYAIFAPVAILVSILLPKVADLSRMGKEGNPQPIASLIAMLAVPLLMAPAVLALAFTLMVVKSLVASFIVALVWLVLASVISKVALHGLGRLFERRRENLLLVATGR